MAISQYAKIFEELAKTFLYCNVGVNFSKIQILWFWAFSVNLLEKRANANKEGWCVFVSNFTKTNNNNRPGKGKNTLKYCMLKWEMFTIECLTYKQKNNRRITTHSKEESYNNAPHSLSSNSLMSS